MKTFSRLLLALGAAALLASPGSAAYLPTPLGAGNVIFDPPAGGDAVDLQSRGQTQLHVSDKGARGSPLNTTGHFNTIGNNAFTFDNVIDLRAGDDIWIANESATDGPATPTGGLAIPCGTPRSPTIANGYWRDACTAGATTCDYFAVEDDGRGGNSAPLDIHSTLIPASPTIWNDVYLSMVPAKSGHTAPIWKDCGSGAHYILSAQPRSVYTITAPGSGYSAASPCHATSDPTNATCAWTATGGGCADEPRGWLFINGGIISGGGVDRDHLGKGCTGPATVNVAAVTGLSGGSGGAITISFLMEAEDAGFIPVWAAPRPYSLTVHPTGAAPDALVATIGTLAGNAATLCTAGTGVNGFTCVPANGRDTTTRPVWHSWTRQMQAAMDAATSYGPNGNGVGVVHIPCGTYDYEEPLIFNSANLAVAGDDLWSSIGAGDGCVVLRPVGNGSDGWAFDDPGGFDHVSIHSISFVGDNTTGGGYFRALGSSHGAIENVYDTHFAAGYAFIGSPGADLANVIGNMDWGYGLATFGYHSTYKNQACCFRTSNIYHNDGSAQTGDNKFGRTSGVMHSTYELNGVATYDTVLQCGSSASWGYAYWLHDDTGKNYKVNTDEDSGNEFLGLHCTGEFASVDAMHVDDCKAHCYNDAASGGVNGAIIGRGLVVGQGAEFQWTRGHISGSALEGVYCDGFCSINLSTMQSNSQPPRSSPGAHVGVLIGPHATNVDIGDDRSVEPIAYLNPTPSQLAPVQIMALPFGTVDPRTISIHHNLYWGNYNNRVISDQVDPASVSTATAAGSFPADALTIALNSPCPPSAYQFQSVSDGALGIIGAVSRCANTGPGGNGRLTLQRKLNGASLGANDTLTIFSYLPPVRSAGLVIDCNPGNNSQGGTPLYDCGKAIGAAAVPLGNPSSGSVGNNGALSLTTPLDVAYGAIYLSMPAAAIYHDATFSGQMSGAGGVGSGSYLSVLSISTGAPQIGDGLVSAGITSGNEFIIGSTDLSNCVGGAIACYSVANLVAAAGPATFNSGSAPGSYFARCSAIDTCILFQETYRKGNAFVSNLPQAPLTPTPWATTGPGAYTQQQGTNNAYQMTVPGYQIGPNDGLRVQVSATFPATTGTKTITCNYGGFSFGSAAFSTTTQSRWAGMLGFSNAGVTNAQFPNLNGNGLGGGGFGATNAGLNGGTVASWQDQALTCNANLTTSDLDWIVIRNLSVEMLPGIN